MSLRSIIAAVAGLLILSVVALPASAASLTVKGEAFVLTLPDGRQLGSAQLIGAELQTSDGQTIRIDAATPAKERATVLLLRFSVRDSTTGRWTPACEVDAYGRQRHAGAAPSSSPASCSPRPSRHSRGRSNEIGDFDKGYGPVVVAS